MKLRIGSRKSDLARIQAYAVGRALQNDDPQLEIEYIFKSSLGDLNQSDPLWKMPEKGVFTEDLTADLKSGTVDLVVHSWKDLPTAERPNTVLAGTLPRADVRDLLLFKKDRVQKNGAVRVMTSSPRRVYNLKSFLAWALPGGNRQVEFQDIRGNIGTRLRKFMDDPNVDGFVVAKAALDRLLGSAAYDRAGEFQDSRTLVQKALALCNFMVLPLKYNPPAAAQGALAIECRRDHMDVLGRVERIQSAADFEAVSQEREILKKYGGGCHQKIGVTLMPRPYGVVHSLRGLTDAGETLETWTLLSSQTQNLGSVQDFFPKSKEDAVFFERRQISLAATTIKTQVGAADALFVARADALPGDYVPAATQILWTAGLQTWKKLAAMGLWVHGSTEGLGEVEDPRLQELLHETLGGRPARWVKLTHQQGVVSEGMPVVATYELVPSAKGGTVASDLRGVSHFFWSSASAFLDALRLEPTIADAHHSSGPGHTAMCLRQTLGPRGPIGVFLSYEEWRDAIRKNH